MYQATQEGASATAPALKVGGGVGRVRAISKTHTSNYIITLMARATKEMHRHARHCRGKLLSSFPQFSHLQRNTEVRRGPVGRDYQTSAITHPSPPKIPFVPAQVRKPARRRELRCLSPTHSTATFINVLKSRQHRVPYKTVCF